MARLLPPSPIHPHNTPPKLALLSPFSPFSPSPPFSPSLPSLHFSSLLSFLPISFRLYFLFPTSYCLPFHACARISHVDPPSTHAQPPQAKPTSSTVDASTTHSPPQIPPNPRLTHRCPATHVFIRVFQQKMPTCPSSHWRWPSSQWAARNACTERSTPS